jgi:topoisomerase IA-like protein
MANGFSVLPPGLGDQTATTQLLIQKLSKKTRTKARRKKKTTRKKTTRRATAKRRTTRRKKKPARLVKGSAAAKRHMAKLRAMRKK